MTPRTNQEVFDIVARHLLTQNEKSITRKGTCVYRSEDGLKCAAGALIPDDLYDEVMDAKDGMCISAVIEDYPALAPYVGDTEFATRLQRLHDDFEVFSWCEKLAAFADAYGLDPKVLSEV